MAQAICMQVNRRFQREDRASSGVPSLSPPEQVGWGVAAVSRGPRSEDEGHHPAGQEAEGGHGGD